jgi:hypothetical protein
VAAGTESAATTCGESDVVPVSVPVLVPDDPPVALRCEDADAGGSDVPAALITTMVAMAATTSPTGTSAVITGRRERNRVGGDASAGLDLALDDALDLGAGRVVDVDLLVFLVGRAGRDDPDGDFDIVFS